MSLSGGKLTDLPVSVQSYIFSHLSRFSSRSISINLDSFRTLHTCLPRDLLAVAKFSASFAEVVGNVLESRAQVLTHQTAHPLHEWIIALAPFVKAVSWYDPSITRHNEHQCDDPDCEYATQGFNALSAERVRLHVLDVKGFSFASCMAKEKLFTSFAAAIECSGESLKEIGLRVAPLVTKAIGKVCFPNLKVAELEVHMNDFPFVPYGERPPSASEVLEMLRALEGHADRSKKKTTLRELRLLGLGWEPCTTHEESCTGLFQSVKTLKLDFICWPYRDDNDAMARFAALFRNLESLHWEGETRLDDFRLIHDACTRLEETHLRLQVADSELSDLTAEMFQLGTALPPCQGKLKSLAVDTSLTLDQLQVLGETNPNLENLEMYLARSNVGALPQLLRSHCRKIRSLDLPLPSGYDGLLGEEEWDTLTEALKMASGVLCEISIGSSTSIVNNNGIAAMGRFLTEILESLGGRIQKFLFNVLPCMGVTLGSKGKVEMLSKLMRTCGERAKNLEHLLLSINGKNRRELFYYRHLLYKFDDEEVERETWEQFLAEKHRMMSALPRLELCDLGYLDELAEARLNPSRMGEFEAACTCHC